MGRLTKSNPESRDSLESRLKHEPYKAIPETIMVSASSSELDTKTAQTDPFWVATKNPIDDKYDVPINQKSSNIPNTHPNILQIHN